MSIICNGPKTGIMIPIPQYPLYTACIAANAAKAVPYYLDGDNNWSTSVQDIKNSCEKAKKDGLDVRAIVVINPSNPTGGCLLESEIKDIIQLAFDEELVILADEVYQANLYQPEERPFFSFKKALRSMPSHIADSVELVSFHSISKGQVGECGRRGGYFELVNFDEEVEQQLYKLASTQLCSPVSGQIAVDVLVKPPGPGEASYELHQKELADIHKSLQERSNKLRAALNKLEGYSCAESQGALYLFPNIKLPSKAIEAAEKVGKPADAWYCLELLRATGICLVPGSGFGQKEGTFHFRTTFLA